MSQIAQYRGTGKRKTSVARVILTPGDGATWVNGRTLDEMLARRPEEVIRSAVKGMLPRTRLGRAQLRKLKVYAGPDHPHAAQQPQEMEVNA